MIHSVRAAVGLGNPLEKFNTNASESINNVLKLKTGNFSMILWMMCMS